MNRISVRQVLSPQARSLYSLQGRDEELGLLNDSLSEE